MDKQEIIDALEELTSMLVIHADLIGVEDRHFCALEDCTLIVEEYLEDENDQEGDS